MALLIVGTFLSQYICSTIRIQQTVHQVNHRTDNIKINSWTIMAIFNKKSEGDRLKQFETCKKYSTKER